MEHQVKPTNTIARSLQVFVLALCGLSFYVLLLVVLCLVVGLAASTRAHARASSENVAWTFTGNFNSACAGQQRNTAATIIDTHQLARKPRDN